MRNSSTFFFCLFWVSNFLISAVAVVYRPRESFEGLLYSLVQTILFCCHGKMLFLIDFLFWVERIHVCSDLSIHSSLSCAQCACVHARAHTHREMCFLFSSPPNPEGHVSLSVASSPCLPTLLVLLTFKSFLFWLFVSSTLIYQILNVFSLFSILDRAFMVGIMLGRLLFGFFLPIALAPFFFGLL